MEKQNLIILSSFCFFLLLLSGTEIQGVQGFSSHPKELFVFGDSYVDTGNSPKNASSWEVPYGITFPGKPDGRYSDGRILTDFLAKYLGLESPIPYRFRKHAPNRLKYGLNFAYGGTGVFNTLVNSPNMSTQIDFFQNLIDESVYKKSELERSLSLVTVSGNDYSTYLAEGGTTQGFPSFIARVVNQTAVNLKRIHDTGVRTVAVAAIEPLGCLPEFTVLNSFKQCNATVNTISTLHNSLLQQAVAELNNESKDSGAFIILDLYDTFTAVLNGTDTTVKFETPILEPCCLGTTSIFDCGSVDAKGEKLYTVCDNPKAAFFWDATHPTQAGWQVVFSELKSQFDRS